MPAVGADIPAHPVCDDARHQPCRPAASRFRDDGTDETDGESTATAVDSKTPEEDGDETRTETPESNSDGDETRAETAEAGLGGVGYLLKRRLTEDTETERSE